MPWRAPRQPPRAAIAAAPAASIAGRQRGSGRAGSRHLATDAFGFELADIGPTAIEVLRQRRRADGRCHSESGLRGRCPGGGRAIDGDGLSHRVRSCCVAVGYPDCSIRANSGR